MPDKPDPHDWAHMVLEIAALKRRVTELESAADERSAWDRFAAAHCADSRAVDAAECADDMLEERRKRFPPKEAP